METTDKQEPQDSQNITTQLSQRLEGLKTTLGDRQKAVVIGALSETIRALKPLSAAETTAMMSFLSGYLESSKLRAEEEVRELALTDPVVLVMKRKLADMEKQVAAHKKLVVARVADVLAQKKLEATLNQVAVTDEEQEKK
ncbi:hypothetical protein LTR09_001103 [Extremus antarcticus]|uniref:Uncharacterized protein n=1 Tax=Extremus antarcticus TaxID=702011 RepID=A0AAJ0LWT0_9PEZI|nr:hypothetical protein LTR09_001103 [Extremus antarcticus]